MASVCKSASRPLKPTLPEVKTTTNAAFGFFNNSITSCRASWMYPSPESLPPCTVRTAIKTSNRFERLSIDPEPAGQGHLGEVRRQPPRHRRHRGRRGQPHLTETHQARDSSIPTIPEMSSVPTTVAHLAAWTRTAQQSSPGTIRTVSLPHMVHDLVRNWIPATPSASPTCRLE